MFLYVDDILIMHSDKTVISDFQKEMMLKFNMVCLGTIKRFLGLEIERDYKNNNLKVHQKTFIEKLLKRFNMSDCKGISTPVEKGLKLTKETNVEVLTKKPYRELIGCLMY